MSQLSKLQSLQSLQGLSIAIRADAGHSIGTGHIIRCHTLAYALVQSGAKVRFVCAEHSGNLIDWLHAKEIPVSAIPVTENLASNQAKDAVLTKEALRQADFEADWVLVDHYQLDAQWEQCFRPAKLFVIDDLENRPHDCDILLDQNYSLNANTRYRNLSQPLVTEHCQLLIGPQYALLKSNFAEARHRLEQQANHGVRRLPIQNIFIFITGSDQHNITQKVLEALTEMNRPEWQINAVISAIHPYRYSVEDFCKQFPNITLHCQVDNMAELMARADLAIGAGGVSTWERLSLGLPSIVLLIADNQVELTEAVASKNLIMNLGWAVDVKHEQIQSAVLMMEQASGLLEQMSRGALAFMDANGVTRVLEAWASVTNVDISLSSVLKYV